MGTRSLTRVYDDRDRVIINLYRQYDGYPSGHGAELAEFLTDMVITNGIQMGETRRTANGMECLAAQLVAHFKTEVGGIYLYSPDITDADQDYQYEVREDSVRVFNYSSKELFSGTWSEFVGFCSEETVS